MAEYEFICEPCKQVAVLVQSMKDNLPEIVCPQCGANMHQNYRAANIIFKGDWPGKNIKLMAERAADEKRLHEVDVAQKDANEILKVRRQGRRAYDEFARKNPQKIQSYNENMRKGIKGK